MVEGESDREVWTPEDTIRVLIASDIHLGYKENDPVRGEDSFTAFEEVLSLAVEYDVDLVLLGGDLFDQAKPSPNCMFKCTQIIRKYCLGDKPIAIELLSDQLQNFSRVVNYEDPNLNVSYPILSIHGNHDDPVGQGSISSLDILSITGLVNYFGKWTDYTQVKISPVLMQKGSTKLAMYGLSHLKDQRLARLFAEQKVEMERPDDSQDWFNMLVLHQNRADRGPGNYIPEKVLPNFLDMVIWGHEHDSLVYPIKGEKGENDEFYVVQPGSTVATSLAASEALPKHCALLQLNKKQFKLTPLPLKTVRPFIFKTIVLSEEDLGQDNVNESEKVQSFLKAKVQEAIDEANSLRSGNPNQPKLPLVVLNVFLERDAQDFSRIRFGQNFQGLVANSNDILNMKKEKKIRERKDNGNAVEGDDVDMAAAAVQAVDVEDLLHAYYAALPAERQLAVLSVRSVTEAVREFTLKKDEDVFRRVFDAHRRRCVEALLESTAETEAEVTEQLAVCKQSLEAADDDQLRSIIDMTKPVVTNKLTVSVTKLNVGNKQVVKTNSKKGVVVVLSSDDESEPLSSSAGRGRGRGRARGRGRGRGRGAGEPVTPPTPVAESQSERRTPRRAAAAKSASWLQTITNNRNSSGSRKRRDSSDIDDSD